MAALHFGDSKPPKKMPNYAFFLAFFHFLSEENPSYLWGFTTRQHPKRKSPGSANSFSHLPTSSHDSCKVLPPWARLNYIASLLAGVHSILKISHGNDIQKQKNWQHFDHCRYGDIHLDNICLSFFFLLSAGADVLQGYV